MTEERNIGNPDDHDTSDDDGSLADIAADNPDTIIKPPQIDAWIMPDASNLPNEVYTTPIPPEAQEEE